MLWMTIGAAFGAPPSDLEGLVQLALARDPEVAALASLSVAAQSRGRAARAPPDPELALGVENVAAPPRVDPLMASVGLTQRLYGFGEGRALATRALAEAGRADAAREQVAADLRLELWQTAARLWIAEQELGLVGEQLLSATRVRDAAFARFASDGGVTGGTDHAVLAQSPDPLAVPASVGFGGLLELDAGIVRVQGERDAIEAEREGEILVLAMLVGEEAAEAVVAEPQDYLGVPIGAPPELRLAEVEHEIALADLRVARTANRPDLGVAVSERLLTDGRHAGADVTVGVTIPLWAAGARTDAARAEVDAAEARIAAVNRSLEIDAVRMAAALSAAEARARALEESALPQASAAWQASSASLSVSGTNPSPAMVRSWEAWIRVGRQALVARREALLLTAALARLGGPPDAGDPP